jgi:hypothetical protein
MINGLFFDDEPAALATIFRDAGYEPEGSEPRFEILDEIVRMRERRAAEPLEVWTTLVRARRERAVMKAEASKLANAAQKLETILKGLLDAKPLLCRLESLRLAPRPRAACRINGQLHELPVHPSVPVERLTELAPWDFEIGRAHV